MPLLCIWALLSFPVQGTSTGKEYREMARASAPSVMSDQPRSPSRTKFEWTLPLPESPFYKREYCWSGHSQVHSCTLCDEELHRTPIFDSSGNFDSNSLITTGAGVSDLDLLAKKYIHNHFISVRHEDNLKEAMNVAARKSNAATKQPTRSSNANAPMIFHSTSTGRGTTKRKARSSRKVSSAQQTCVICKASSRHVVGAKTDGPYLLSSAHLDQLHHKRSMKRFQELADEEMRLINYKKPSTANAIAFLSLEIVSDNDLPTDVGLLILRFAGIQKEAAPTTHFTAG